jgi:hypothetical protein
MQALDETEPPTASTHPLPARNAPTVVPFSEEIDALASGKLSDEAAVAPSCCAGRQIPTS